MGPQFVNFTNGNQQISQLAGAPTLVPVVTADQLGIATVAISSVISTQASAESTHAMPVTRDMSAGKRTTLQLWIYLVQQKYQAPHLSLSALGAHAASAGEL
jgi:hypothetical protein